MAKSEQKLQAHALRRKGKSIGDIATLLGVSKGSVSIWCRDIKLSKSLEQRLRQNSIRAGHAGRLAGTLKNKQARLQHIEFYKDAGKREIGRLSKRDLTLIAAALFWAEGAKTGSRFIFVNSDPHMILCMYRYLMEVERIDPKQIFLRVQINRIHEHRMCDVSKFWTSLLGLSPVQIGDPYYIETPPKKMYENHQTYYGVARLGVRKGTVLQYKFLGYIDALKTQ